MTRPGGGIGSRPATAFLGLGVIVLGALAASTRIRAYDYFWHLGAGRLIVGQGTIPRADPFSFTAGGIPWVDHGWLYQLLLWSVWERFGHLGAWSVKVALGAAVAGIAFRHLHRLGIAPAGIAVLCLVALRGASPRFNDRPEMVTLLFVALGAAWLCRPGTGAGRWAPLALIPLTAVWANFHAGAILAPLMAGAALAGVFLDRLLGRSTWRGSALHLVPVTLAVVGSTAALLLTPYGPEMLRVPFKVTGIIGQAWAPNPEWTRPSPAAFPLFYAAVAGLILSAVWLRRRVEGVPLALGLLAAVLALRYVRNVGVFFVVLPFALAPVLTSAGPALRRVRAPLTAALVVFGGLWLALLPKEGMPGPGLQPGRYPVQASDFLEAEGIRGRLFNEVAFGGYLIWRFPGRPVFIDGRNEVYVDLLQEIHEALPDPARFWALTERWEIEAAMLRYPPTRPQVLYPGGGGRLVERAWSEVYFPRHDWALVHWDDTAMVRVRRASVDPAWLELHEYRHLNPDDWPHLRERVLSGALDVRMLTREIERKLAEDPGCRRAVRLRDELLRLVRTAGAPPRPETPIGPVTSQ